MKPLCLLVLPSLLLVPRFASAEIVERVIAKVNGDIVTLSEFEARQFTAVQTAGIGSDKIEAFLRDNNARILQEAVDDLLIVQRADELDIKLSPDSVKSIIDNDIKKENHIPTDEALRDQLRKEGMTLDDLKRSVAQTYLRRMVLQRELPQKVIVTDDEVRADYEAHKDDYARPATVHLLEIRISAETPDARAKAVDVVTRARAGEDFAELARTLSTAPTRGAGGDLGDLRLKELSLGLQKAAAPLRPGEISDPITVGDGYGVFKLVARTEAGVRPLEDVKGDIRKHLTEARQHDVYQKYVEDLRKTANVEVRVREVPLQVSRPVGQTTLLDPPAPDDLPVTVPKPGAALPPQSGPPTPASADEPDVPPTTQPAAP